MESTIDDMTSGDYGRLRSSSNSSFINPMNSLGYMATSEPLFNKEFVKNLGTTSTLGRRAQNLSCPQALDGGFEPKR